MVASWRGVVGGLGLMLVASGWLATACGQREPLSPAPVAVVQAVTEDTAGAAVDEGDGTDDATAPDATACNTQLAPTVGIPVPGVLAANGPWQLCGTYGTGGAHIVKTSYDGRRVVVVTDSGQAWVLAAGSFALKGVFAHGNGQISFAGLSPDGRLLVTVDDPGQRVALWNVNKHKLLRVMTRPPLQTPSLYGLGDVAFSHDGRRVAVVSGSHVDVFDTETGAPLPISFRSDLGGAMRVAFVAGDTRLVLARFIYWGNGPYAGWGEVDLVDANTGDNPQRLDKELYIQLPAIAVSGDGNVFAVGVTEAGFWPITLFDAHTGQSKGDLPTQGVPLGLDATGARIAVAEPSPEGPNPPPSSPLVVTIRDTVAGDTLSSASIERNAPYPRTQVLTATPNLESILVGNVGARLLTRVKAASGRPRAIACGTGHSADVAALAVSTDDAVLVTTGNAYDNQRLAWNVATGAPTTAPPDSDLRSPSATSRDGTLRAENDSHWQPTFNLRDTATDTVLRTIGPQPTRPVSFDFAPDNSVIAAASERDPVDRGTAFANTWEVATGELQQQLRVITSVPEFNAQPVLFGDDGRRLFVSGYGTTAVWCR